MPYDLEFTLRVSVNSMEEADKITEAVYSGLASELIRFGVLYGKVPLVDVNSGIAGVNAVQAAPAMAGVDTVQATPAMAVEHQPPIKKDPPVELKRVEDKVGRVTTEQEPAPKKPKGFRGIGRMRRS